MTLDLTDRERKFLTIIVGDDTEPCVHEQLVHDNETCATHGTRWPCTIAMAVAALYGLEPPPPPPPTPPDRAELVQLCTDGVVPHDKWYDRDTAGAQRQLGELRALIAAGCSFNVQLGHRGMLWDVYVEFRGFNAVESGGIDSDTFYCPTRPRLDAVAGKDWYC